MMSLDPTASTSNSQRSSGSFDCSNNATEFSTEPVTLEYSASETINSVTNIDSGFCNSGLTNAVNMCTTESSCQIDSSSETKYSNIRISPDVTASRNSLSHQNPSSVVSSRVQNISKLHHTLDSGAASSQNTDSGLLFHSNLASSSGLHPDLSSSEFFHHDLSINNERLHHNSSCHTSMVDSSILHQDQPDSSTNLPSLGSRSLGSMGVEGLVHKEGYDYEFDPPADPKYHCPVCMLVLRHPVQTACGHRFCQACIMTWVSSNAPLMAECPSCKERLVVEELFPDNFANREIRNLTLKCTNTSRGCATVMELHQLQNHLDHDCQHVLVPCPNKCSDVLLKKDLASHLSSQCLRRPKTCSLCGQIMTSGLAEEHALVCPKFIISCEKCSISLPRQSLSNHLSCCPKAEIKCKLAPFGCSYQCLREEMAKHMEYSVSQHVSILAGTLIKFQEHLKFCPLSNSLSQISERLQTCPKVPLKPAQESGNISTKSSTTPLSANISTHSDSPIESIVYSNAVPDWLVQNLPPVISVSDWSVQTEPDPMLRSDWMKNSNCSGLSHSDWCIHSNLAPIINQSNRNTQRNFYSSNLTKFKSSGASNVIPNPSSMAVETVSIDSLFLTSEACSSIGSDYISIGSLLTTSGESLPSQSLDSINCLPSISSLNDLTSALRSQDNVRDVSGVRSPRHSSSSSSSTSSSVITTISATRQGQGTCVSDPGALHRPNQEQGAENIVQVSTNALERFLSNKMEEMERHTMLEMERRLVNSERNLMLRFCGGDYIWRIGRVHEKKQSTENNGVIHSPGFYTSPNGYRFCVRVNLNGIESGFNKYIGLFVHLVRGDNDDLLDWPFCGNITMRILDQSKPSKQSGTGKPGENSGLKISHSSNSLNEENPELLSIGSSCGSMESKFGSNSAGQSGSQTGGLRPRQGLADIIESVDTKPGFLAFERPSSSRNHKGFGYKEFAPVSILDDVRYVKNDTLIVHVTVKAQN